MAPINTKAVANHFIDIADRQNQKLTSIKLQKLVYYAHGWHLAIEKVPLIDEKIEAWSYGIVIPSIYHEFKEFGREPIGRHLVEFDSIKSEWVEPKINDPEFIDKLLHKIWDTYGEFNPIQLSNMTHGAGTPWASAVSNPDVNNPIVEDGVITNYFVSVISAVRERSSTQRSLLSIGLNDIVIDTDHTSNEPDEKTLQELSDYERQAKWLYFDGSESTWKKICDYALLWNARKRKGKVKIVLEDGVNYKMFVKTASELKAIENIFRNEQIVYYNVVSGSIASAWKTIAIEGPPV